MIFAGENFDFFLLLLIKKLFQKKILENLILESQKLFLIMIIKKKKNSGKLKKKNIDRRDFNFQLLLILFIPAHNYRFIPSSLFHSPHLTIY